MKILIVEDEASIVKALQTGLAAEGFVTEAAMNGIDGLWMAEENEFDVIILDIMLPGLSGYDVCRRLRSRGATVPILMLTAKDGEYDEADALDLGADDFLSKPFSFVVLLARLRALLRRAPIEREPVLTAGSIRLDPAARRCWRGEEEVTLTAREFSLAEFMIRRKGQVVSRNIIAEHVWDSELDIDSNVIEVYIGYLRRKLDDGRTKGLIDTVRGTGYRLMEPAEKESDATHRE
ncbi:two-component system OmpR family response regulator [Cryobacterium sp. CAN_C3]|uniref:response regulator transcription factor n=1 Tax=unclassified Cryobacterium TaxID=2649013 RepID=UPI0018CBE103|nr:response regulator transcription factor [Cryobacterium sp. CAN_C3]MEC5155431.1 two-component system OmpR family response regulator [Cryobacterium sp. CAN_C3]